MINWENLSSLESLEVELLVSHEAFVSYKAHVSREPLVSHEVFDSPDSIDP